MMNATVENIQVQQAEKHFFFVLLNELLPTE
jgi:hypothetical protein